jgi:membrane protein DedA with SNARE-associated domain
VARMNLPKFIVYSTAGAFLWSTILVFGGTVLGKNWEAVRHALQPFDLVIALAAAVLIIGFVWWRVGMPGRPRRAPSDPPPSPPTPGGV